jgi:holo-[acyl-carrier protein] synthase
MKMKVYTGIDLIEIERFEKIEPPIRERFIRRVLTENERLEIKDSNASLAGKFAAKEAVVKAIGCGIGPISFRDMEILHDQNGRPMLSLHDNAKKIAREMKLIEWSVSISHSQHYAVATVTFLGE